MTNEEYEKYMEKCAKEDARQRVLEEVEELKEGIAEAEAKKAEADNAIVNTIIKLTEKR